MCCLRVAVDRPLAFFEIVAHVERADVLDALLVATLQERKE
jgi:hypothetical protein